MMNKTTDLTREAKWLLEEKYAGVESIDYQKDLQHLINGVPVDYVIGFSKFLGAHIDLSFRPLIPRTETEYWVSHLIDDIKRNFSHSEQVTCLDMFAGSGCIGLAILCNIPSSVVYFSDIDDNAISQVTLNLKLNNISENRYKIIRSDMYDAIGQDMVFDIITANPPYIDRELSSRVQESVVSYEPENALFAEDKGLYFLNKTLQDSLVHMNEDSILYIEYDDQQVYSLRNLARDLYKYSNFQKDQYDNFRFARLSK